MSYASLALSIIEQAKADHASEEHTNVREFVQSPWFRELCGNLELDPDITAKAVLGQPTERCNISMPDYPVPRA